jgi:hypothetical protein
MTKPEGISQSAWDEAEIDAALDTILRSVGSSPIKHYMPLSQERARKAMRELLAAAIRQGSQPSNVIPVRGTVR